VKDWWVGSHGFYLAANTRVSASRGDAGEAKPLRERRGLSQRCWREAASRGDAGEARFGPWTPGFWMKDLRLGREKTEAGTLLVAGGRDTEALGSS